MDDVLREVFEFISRKMLGNSTSLVNRRFNRLAQSKMHIRGKHFVESLLLEGRQIKLEPSDPVDIWQECCLMKDYIPYFLPISPTIPENILGLREVHVDHFSGPQLAPFLNETIGHFLTGCSLRIEFKESFSCEDTEQAEFDQFIRQFYVRCKAIAVPNNYHRPQFQQMPAFLLQPQIMAKLKLFQINDSIPREHLDLFVDWLHTPFLNGDVVEERKLQFETADRELLDQLVGTIRQRFSSLCQCQPVPFRVEIQFTTTTPRNFHPFARQEANRQFVPYGNFLEQNESTGEILSLRSSSIYQYYHGKSKQRVELRRRHVASKEEEWGNYGYGLVREENLREENSGCQLSIHVYSFSI